MAGGWVQLVVNTTTGGTDTYWSWSDNGLLAGNLQSANIVTDLSRNALFVTANPGVVQGAAGGTPIPAILAAGSALAGAVTIQDGATNTLFTTAHPGAIQGVSGGVPVPVLLTAGAALIGTVEIQDASGNVLLTSAHPGAVQGVAGGVPVSVGGLLTNLAGSPVLTRPNNATAYINGNLIASNTVAASVVVPSVSVARVGGGSFLIRRVRLTTTATTGWNGATFRLSLWSAAPTYTNGDGGAYVPATGASSYLGSFDLTMIQFGDGATGIGIPTQTLGQGSEAGIQLASGQIVYWDLQYTGGSSLTPIANQTFTLTPECYQN